ncbi:hypothetical protein ACLOJK_004714 [Asimina triloba]
MTECLTRDLMLHRTDISPVLHEKWPELQEREDSDTTEGRPPLLNRPAAGTATGGATVAGRRRRGGTRPATGPTTHRRSNPLIQNPTEISAAPPL